MIQVFYRPLQGLTFLQPLMADTRVDGGQGSNLSHDLFSILIIPTTVISFAQLSFPPGEDFLGQFSDNPPVRASAAR